MVIYCLPNNLTSKAVSFVAFLASTFGNPLIIMNLEKSSLSFGASFIYDGTSRPAVFEPMAYRR